MTKQPQNEETREKGPNPFVVVEATCPVCGAVNAQRKLKSHLFLEQSPDIVFRPAKIVRTRPGLEEYDPLLYYIWLCPVCLFAAGRPNFEDLGQGTSLSSEELGRLIREKLESKAALAKLASALGNGADREVRDGFQALRLTLSAILQLQSALDEAVKAALALARYYLRLAWLYHDLEDRESGLRDQLAKAQALTSGLKRLWPNVPQDEGSALRAAAALYQMSLSQSRLLEDDLDTVKAYLLVARIRAKLGALDQARSFWDKARETARKFEMARKKNDPHSQKLLLKSENMKNAVKETAELLTSLSAESSPTSGREGLAREIIDNYFGTDIKELRRMMADEGIDRETIDRLVPPKSGGLRGMLSRLLD